MTFCFLWGKDGKGMGGKVRSVGRCGVESGKFDHFGRTMGVGGREWRVGVWKGRALPPLFKVDLQHVLPQTGTGMRDGHARDVTSGLGTPASL